MQTRQRKKSSHTSFSRRVGRDRAAMSTTPFTRRGPIRRSKMVRSSLLFSPSSAMLQRNRHTRFTAGSVPALTNSYLYLYENSSFAPLGMCCGSGTARQGGRASQSAAARAGQLNWHAAQRRTQVRGKEPRRLRTRPLGGNALTDIGTNILAHLAQRTGILVHRVDLHLAPREFSLTDPNAHSSAARQSSAHRHRLVTLQQRMHFLRIRHAGRVLRLRGDLGDLDRGDQLGGCLRAGRGGRSETGRHRL